MLDERWSEEADEIGGALRKLLAVESAPARVRDAEDRADGRDLELERRLAEFGLTEAMLAADLLARIAYELGRALAPCAIVEAMPARLVLGCAATSIGFDGPVPASLAQVAVLGDGGRVHVEPLNGIPRRTSAGDYLVDHRPSADTAPAGSAEQAGRMRRLAALLESARLVGAGQALLEQGAAYAREREQFGKVIGSFQGVSHRLANVAGALDGAELLVRKAAFSALETAGGDGAPAALFAHMVWAKAVDAARLAATDVHQVFGGNGFAMEYDVQLYSRRIRSWANRRSRPAADLRAVARAMLDPAARDAVKFLWHHEQGLALPRWANEADA